MEYNSEKRKRHLDNSPVPEVKKIIWVGRQGNEYFQSDNYLLKRLEEHLKKQFVLSYYTDRKSFNYGSDLNSILTLIPDIINNSYDNIIYNISNHEDCLLFYKMFKVLPGIVILHDCSIFNLLLYSVRYSNDKDIINRLLIENSKSISEINKLDPGLEFILGRSTEVYTYLINCLDVIINSASSIILEDEFFLKFICENYPEVNKKKFFLLKSIRNIKSNSKVNIFKNIFSESNKKKILIVKSPFCEEFNDIQQIIFILEGVKNYRKLKFPLVYEIKDNEIIKFESSINNDDFTEFFIIGDKKYSKDLPLIDKFLFDSEFEKDSINNFISLIKQTSEEFLDNRNKLLINYENMLLQYQFEDIDNSLENSYKRIISDNINFFDTK